MSDELSDGLKSTILDGARSVAERYGKRPPQGAQIMRCTVSAANGDGTLDVDVRGAVLESVPATIACSGAKAGDTVVIERMGGLLIATGIISTATNRLATGAELDAVRDSVSRLADYRFERLWSNGNQRVDFESSCGIATVSWTFKFDGITSWRLDVPEYVRAEHASYFPAALVRSDNTPIDHVAYVLLNSTSNYMQFFAASATASNVWHEGCISYHLKRS